MQDHREDANYLNVPIEHYHEMATIFGNGLATGVYAKGSNDPLGIELTETDNGPKLMSSDPSEQTINDDGTPSTNNGVESSGTKPVFSCQNILKKTVAMKLPKKCALQLFMGRLVPKI